MEILRRSLLLRISVFYLFSVYVCTHMLLHMFVSWHIGGDQGTTCKIQFLLPIV